MKCVYIAGPFRGDNAWEVENNIRRAESLALAVWRLGAAAICPHANTRFFSGVCADRLWLDGDIEMLRRCDGVITTPDWQRSAGAREEVAFAYAHGIPCFGTLETLAEWLAVQDEVDSSRKIQAEREQYFNPRLGPMLEESERNRLIVRHGPSC